ncbi:MAG: glycosyltransferase family 2 protein [Armatimonadota bacterium]
MSPKISIIVPVYNAEKYLRRCLDSLVSQTLDDIEIIAVNDGSTDNSENILNQYKEKDSRIIAINRVNSGLSDARNCGVEHASGQYIGFIDSDDWVDLCMYSDMYNEAISRSADVVMCTYLREYPGGSAEKAFNLPEMLYFPPDEVRDHVLRRIIGPVGDELAKPDYLDAWSTVWSKIYKRDVITDNSIKFVDTKIIGSAEDALFNILAFYHTRAAVFINKPYYHYWRTNSSSFTSTYKPRLLEQWGCLYSLINEFIKKNELPAIYEQALSNRICISTLNLGLNILSSNESPYLQFKNISNTLNSSLIRNSIKHFDLSYFDLKWKLFYFCVKHRINIIVFVTLKIINYLRNSKLD